MPDPWGRFTAPGELPATFRHFAERRCGDYAPLYAHLGTRIAGDAELLAIAANASPGQSPPDLCSPPCTICSPVSPITPWPATTRP